MPRIAHTADLGAADLSELRALLDTCFDGDFGDDDWDNTLGGMHALLWAGPELVGHAALVQRRLVHGGRALRTGYVEGLAVHPAHRRRGHGGALMAALERIVRAAYQLGALSTTEQAAPLYAGRGWQLWRGPTSALTPSGTVRTPEDDGGVYVLPCDVSLDLTAELTCDWRDGDVW